MDKRKKILIIGPSPIKSKGGMATVIEEIEKDKTLKDEFDIDIYESYIDGYKIVRFIYSIYSFIKFCFTKRNYDFYHIHVASRGSTFRKGYYVDVIKKWNKKVILHIHGAQYLVFFNEISTKKKIRVKEILKKSDMVIALSQDWKNKFHQTFGLTNCFVLENGIDMERLTPAIQNPILHQKSFLTLGRLGQRKGTYDLVEAIDIARKTIPNIKCYLAGDGEVEKIKELVRTKCLEKNIDVVGWVNFEEKLELLKLVSTVVLPSYNEGLPMSILEGMACGKAIISTNVGAIPEVISEENGILVPTGNPEALSKALIKCCTNKKMVKEFSLNNRKRVKKKYSVEHMHKKLADLYYDLDKI